MAGRKEILKRVLSVVEVDSWSEFAGVISRTLGDYVDDRFLFRGHGSNRFGLVSSFDRKLRTTEADTRADLRERLLVQLRAIAKVQGVAVPSDEEGLWAVAQHYGLDTPLLDWTVSRYVAAFFAYAGLEFEVDNLRSVESNPDLRVSVFALDLTSPVWRQKEVTIIKAADLDGLGNERMRRQRGAFTLNESPRADLIEFAADYFFASKDEVDLPSIYRFDVPALEVSVALRSLAEMRISGSELFPGPEGVAIEARTWAWLNRDKTGSA